MKSENMRHYAERTAGLVLAAVLIRSASAHAGNPYFFLSTVYSYRIVGVHAGLLAAATLPAVQFALATCLLLYWWPRPVYLASLVLFAGFVAIQSSAIGRGLDISCGCFGAGDSLKIGPSTVAVAASCAAASLLGFVLSRRPAEPRGLR